MMRSLWTAASGMTSQQLNVDTIANNLSNVNTYGYKKERLEFKSLMYETLQRADQDPANGAGRPVNLQVGHGVRPVASARIFTQGTITATDIASDFAIDGPGFFVIMLGEDEYAYTRDGAAKVSATEDGELALVTSEGYPYTGIDEEPLLLPEGVTLASLIIDESGEFFYLNEDNEVEALDIQFNIVQFPNVQGLEAIGRNLYLETPASGEPLMETEEDLPNTSRVLQGVLELANVQVADEMINLIVAQRAYEMSSKAIQTSDDMLAQANNLKRS